jgi:hypothetical protein
MLMEQIHLLIDFQRELRHQPDNAYPRRVEDAAGDFNLVKNRFLQPA